MSLKKTTTATANKNNFETNSIQAKNYKIVCDVYVLYRNNYRSI